jgi:hypothetical protein
MIYCNKGSTNTIQPKPAAMAVQRTLMYTERRPFIMYLRQMRSLNKILFTDPHQFTSTGKYTIHSSSTTQNHTTIHPNSTTKGPTTSTTQSRTSAQTTIRPPASGRSKNTMTCLNARKQQPKACRK